MKHLQKKIEALERIASCLFDKKLRVKAASRYSLDWFVQAFPERVALQPSDFHRELCEVANDVLTCKIHRLLIQAPRGSAKSTYISFGLVVFAILVGEPYILILSDSSAQAAKFLADIRYIFEPILTKSTSSCIVLGNKSCVEAFGSGAKIRGRRFLSDRPTLIIVDDPQSNSDIISSSERDYSWDWFTREVIPAGSYNSRIITIGTNIHPESIVARCESLLDWKVIKYPAILGDFSESIANEYSSRIVSGQYSLDEIERDISSRTSLVSFWPARWRVADLIKIYAEIGSQAFMSEYQQVSSFGFGKSLWDGELVDNCVVPIKVFPSSVEEIIQAVDPSEGKDTSDYQAHCVGGVDNTGTIYAWVDRRRDRDWPSYVAHLAYQFSVSAIVVETNGTMNLAIPAIEHSLHQYAKIADFSSLPQIIGIKQRKPKSVRIQVLSHYIRSGKLKIINSPGVEEFVKEAKTFPLCKHDDVLDCLSSLVIELETRYSCS